ncbi:DeoR/GlpR family DNA-binding transcription regulator [Micromonospora cremea]|uniref:DNA-binding transcriptional regulator of sugar metabolism, DeoR/GlpR family n=1 Tax=Micromonospora cremea TaxID=709881 RepID=A0A1N5WSG2_9ACTN|nr:DNA-binding transcriptional regulator of sugar metabolism, DeoR/GlpR family [Micromonospora cremea]
MSTVEAATDRADGRDRPQRLQALLDILGARGRLSVAEAASALQVSEATVRRDFTTLAEQQLAARTHGGVVATSVSYDLPVRYRDRGDNGVKERIAAIACELVELGDVVAFNGGTTTSATARRVAARVDLAQAVQRPAVTVVTNALNIATEMVLRRHVRTVILGGVALPQSYELTGPLATMVLNELWLDVLILGVDAFSPDGGTSCHDEGEAGIDATMVRRSRRVVVVAGSEKLGRHSFARICDVSAVDTLVTDDGADAKVVADLRAAGVNVLLA